MTLQTLTFQLDRPLPKGKNKKVIRLKKDGQIIGVQIMKEFVGLKAKTYSLSWQQKN